MIALDGLPLAVAPSIFIAGFASSAAITFIVERLDPDSIGSLRRIFGLSFVSNVVWAIPLAIGSAFSWASKGSQPVVNEFILGAFLAWSFELLVINGAFVSSTALSLCIAAIQPMAMLLPVSVQLAEFNSGEMYAAVLGLVTLGITAGFLLKFKTFKTVGIGINSLQIFQSFLKTWVSHKPTNLENYFRLYSQDQLVTTRVMLAGAEKLAALVLPGVHPGPFYPVGSYDLSELIYHELSKLGIVPMVLHGLGGHERNLPTNELAKRYAAEVARIVATSETGDRVTKMQGPTCVKVGPTTVTTVGFGNHDLAFISNAPNNTDDLDPKTIDGAISAAKGLDTDPMLVDAHNSIGGGQAQQPSITEADWRGIFSGIKGSPEDEFEVGMAHSSELHFDYGADISDGGIAVLVFKKRAAMYVQVASDSNNAAAGLRQMTIDGLKADNIDLIELCTSDTHKSAARYLTDRGYSALGEDSNPETIVATIKKLAKLAASRLSAGYVIPIASNLTMPLIGEKSIDDFAALTRDAVRFARAYATAAFAAILIICSITALL